MATARRKPSGKWQILIYIGKDENGKRKYKSITGTDKRKVEREAAIYADAHRGFNVRGALTVGDALEAFIASRRAILSPSTLRGYESIQKAMRKQYGAFYSTKAEDITRDVLQRLVNDMASKGTSAKTIRNRYGLVTAALSQEGYNINRVTLPSRQKSDPVVATVDMVKELLAKAEENDNGMYVPIALAAMCGMRRSEVVGLDISDINDSGVAHIHRSTVIGTDLKPVTKNTTKTYESDRYVQIPKIIERRIKKQGYVCQFDNPERITERFEHIVKQCGFDGLRFHDLRHFWASHLHAIGISDAFIMEHGGWRTDVMKRIYRHSMPDMEKQAQKAINKAQKALL